MVRTAIETARTYVLWVSNPDAAPMLDEMKCSALVLTTTAPRRGYGRSTWTYIANGCRTRRS